MKTLAVTGGIGSGKSTVAAILSKMPGVRVVNADDEAKRLMVEDDVLRSALIARFGASTFLEDGSLNRPGLAERVFSDSGELQALNALVHPVVREALVKSVEQARWDRIELFVYDVALIKEIDVVDILDTVLLVDAPSETRIERVMARSGLSRADVLSRVQNQDSPDDLRELADFVIENDSDLTTLRHAIEALYHALIPD